MCRVNTRSQIYRLSSGKGHREKLSDREAGALNDPCPLGPRVSYLTYVPVSGCQTGDHASEWITSWPVVPTCNGGELVGMVPWETVLGTWWVLSDCRLLFCPYIHTYGKVKKTRGSTGATLSTQISMEMWKTHEVILTGESGDQIYNVPPLPQRYS